MNGIEKIIQRIEADARAEADETVRQCEEQCRAAKEEYDKAAQTEYWNLVHDGVKECEQRIARLGGAAEMEAKKSVLAMKQEMVSKAFDRARELFCSMDEEQYSDFLAKQACSASVNGMEELVFNEKDQRGAGKLACKKANELLKAKNIPGKLTVSEETRDILGGVIVKQGDIEANCSIEKLTELCRNELASQVAELMFE